MSLFSHLTQGSAACLELWHLLRAEAPLSVAHTLLPCSANPSSAPVWEQRNIRAETLGRSSWEILCCSSGGWVSATILNKREPWAWKPHAQKPKQKNGKSLGSRSFCETAISSPNCLPPDFNFSWSLQFPDSEPAAKHSSWLKIQSWPSICTGWL